VVDQNQLFTLALGINSPWKISSIEFDAGAKRLDILIDFPAGSRFRLGGDSKDPGEYPVHDTFQKEWRHLNFFQHECYIKARTPRVRLGDGSVLLVTPPWAGRELGFTLLFEALLMQLMKYMAVRQVETVTGVTDDKLWALLGRYVTDARALTDMSTLQSLGVDETSIRKGHNYVSLFVDASKSQTLFVAEGKGSGTFEEFRKELEAHGGKAESVTTISMDMSPAFIKGAREQFPDAQPVFDKFHITKMFNSAIDEVRRAEQKSMDKEDGVLLKNSRWVFLKNRENLTPRQQQTLAAIEMQGSNLKTFRMLRMRESLQEVYRVATSAEDFRSRMMALRMWLARSRLEPAMALSRMMKEHWDGIVRWFDFRVTNAILEGINSLVKSAAARARGFRTVKNYKSIIFLITGKLNFSALNPAIITH